MIRVLHIGPDERALGGIACVIRTYMRCLANRSLSVRRLATVNEGHRLKKLFAAAAAYVRAPFEIMRVDLVHVHTASRNSWRRKAPLVILTKLQRRKLVIHIHAGGFADFLDSMGRSRRWLNIRLLSLADCVVCLSPSTRAELAKHLHTIPVVTIPNPCRFFPCEEKVCREPGVEILFTGAIARPKGVFDLVRAFALVVRECPREKLRLVIAGGGKAEACRELAREWGVEDNVSLPGWLASRQLQEAYAKADIYCLPSYIEGVPMGVLEAMAFALPIVASPVGGIPDLVDDGVHGLFVPPGDVNALALALRRLIDNPVARESMGAACRQRVASRYAPQQVGRQLDRLYHSLLRGNEPEDTELANRVAEPDENDDGAFCRRPNLQV